MKKSNAKEKICGLASYAVLTVLTVAACWFFAGRYGVFGANMDWISQHSVFPEYFRQQFYKTGQFFPEYAANIGGGQNIYNFSYYGLYNPIVLIAYLLPFVKMSDYLMAASVICLAVSVCLLYGWLKKRRFSTEIALGVAVLFLLAGPMIYQSCHQIMFVQYMPFLLMTFLGVDRYWEKGKPGLYTLGVFLMILTSFYFSIAGMAAIFLYGWYGYPKGIRKEKTVWIPGSDDRGGTFSRCIAGSYGICDPAAKRKFPKSESERTADAESAAGQFTVRHLQRGADGYSGGGFAWRDRVWIDPGAGGIGGLRGTSDGSCICLGI